MGSQAILVVLYVLLLIAAVVVIIVATAMIRRSDRTVTKPRAITAEYELKMSEQDTDRIRKDWASYYDGDRGNQDDDDARR